ncbi:LOW QUALITY PROTEIN: ras-related protein Rab-18-like [Sturnira hondurensis]|uniref:LOW QUALITY PROTEIN: ras-related protein Rab-18-like n=1 Tax=Sturnira hondurensis TaxID=192404 RepID=UPI001879FC52|nr:LOW QUALITY PROTEIN: ras-related protein Rab-18-like [Sturnira hondurensis]
MRGFVVTACAQELWEEKSRWHCEGKFSEPDSGGWAQGGQGLRRVEAVLTTLKSLIHLIDIGAGKSSLLLRLTADTFDPELAATVGVDFKVKTVSVHGNKAKLAIWDSAGEERFRTRTPGYCGGAQGVLSVHDITRRDAFVMLGNWLNGLETYCMRHDIVNMLVGNKTEKENHERQVGTPVMVYMVPLRNLLKGSFGRLDGGEGRTGAKEPDCHTGEKAMEQEPAEVIPLCHKLWEMPSLVYLIRY